MFNIINIPCEVNQILTQLTQNGFEAYIVGGCVRDCLMGNEPKDWDITTNAKPAQVKNIFVKTVDTGIAHGTVTVILNKKHFEVTTYRIDGEYKDCRRPQNVFFTDDLTKDLSRRDFTINAIAYNDTNKFVDPFGGQIDIKNKLIKCVGDANLRFNEDALRMMRALRFSCQLNFEIESQTYECLCKNVPLIKFVSIERIRDEFLKLISAANLLNFHFLVDSQILKYVSLDLHQYLCDNLEGVMKALGNSQKNISILLATLFYKMAPDKAFRLVKFLRLDNKTCDNVRIILGNLNLKLTNDPYGTKKIISNIGFENFFALVDVQKNIGQISNSDDVKKFALSLQNECIFLKDLAVNGDDLMQIGFDSGKKIGQTLNYLLDIVHQFPQKNSFEQLISLAQNLK